MALAGIDIAASGQRSQFAHPVSGFASEKTHRHGIDIGHEDFTTEASTNLLELVRLRVPVRDHRAVELAHLVCHHPPYDVAEQSEYNERYENVENTSGRYKTRLARDMSERRTYSVKNRHCDPDSKKIPMQPRTV